MYFYCYAYVFSLLCMFYSVYSVFIVPTGTLRLPWLTFSRAFSSVVRQMPGYNSQRRGTVRTLPKLCRSVYCLCVNVYCTTATGWQPNCSWQIYHISLTYADFLQYLFSRHAVHRSVRYSERLELSWSQRYLSQFSTQIVTSLSNWRFTFKKLRSASCTVLLRHIITASL